MMPSHINKTNKTAPNRVKKIAFFGCLIAITVVLSALESVVVLPMPMGVKLGLSNIVIMYAVFCLGAPSAVALCLFKALFVVLTRGVIAGLLSLTGGFFSVFVIILLNAIFFDRISYALISVFGAITHNMAQYALVSLMLSVNLIWIYLPTLIISGVVMGLATGVILSVLMPIIGGENAEKNIDS